ncbi:MAG TPA: MFS transporter [Ilumatobacteraceae bacterium]|nr:MFS transporter [Ilumatobacteraceae bacterium]HRB01908.1 MFS transporter [Ilumatobacteraceae bacterium]
MRVAEHVEQVERPRWGSFALVCGAYLVATTGEQLLSPLYPTASKDLGIGVGQAGIVFGLLTISIAVFNLVGGLLLRRVSVSVLVRTAALVGAVGSATTATTHSFGQLIIGQMVLGASAGLFFPAGLQAVALLAGPARKGFAMGIYGVAFSGGLLLAAVLGAVGSTHDWRTAFWIAAALGGAAAVGGAGSARSKPVRGSHTKFSFRTVMALPTAVGTVLAVCQYGAIPFLTTFAVNRWGLTAASAATVLIVGRVISIVAKVIGGASADRVGARTSARRTGVALTLTGLAWVLLPGGPATYGLAALFAGMVSSLGPIANVLAVEQFGKDGMALGAYRSVQIALGAAASASIGLAGAAFGLRPTLAVATLTPLALLWICRDKQPRPVAAP